MTEIKITDKAGVTLKTAGKYCPEDIGVTIDESLLGGGSGGIEGIIEANALPKHKHAVPNNGYVEKVYFNTSLTNDEVVRILNTLPYIEGGSVILVAEDLTFCITVTKGETSGFGFDWKIGDLVTGALYFSLSDGGWQNFNNPVSIGKNVVSSFPFTNPPMPSGTANENIAYLFATSDKFDDIDVDPTKIYYLKNITKGLLAFNPDANVFMDVIKEFESYGATVTSTFVKTRPTNNILISDLESLTMHGYYVENENDVLVYGDFMGDGNLIWASLEEVLFDNQITCGGVISNFSDAVDPTKYYVYVGGGFFKYVKGAWVEYVEGGIFPTGTLEIDKVGLYDVSSYEYVNVNYSSAIGNTMAVGEIDVSRISKLDIQTLSYYLRTGYHHGYGHLLDLSDRGITGTMAHRLVRPYMFAGTSYLTIDFSKIDYSSTKGISIESRCCFKECGASEIKFPTDIGLEYLTCTTECFSTMPNLKRFEVKLISNGHLNLYKAVFKDCSSLEVVKFDGGVMTSGVTVEDVKYQLYETFKGCSKLKKVVFSNYGSLRPFQQLNAFPDNPDLLIYVPDDLVDLIKYDNTWVNESNKIRPMSEYVEE